MVLTSELPLTCQKNDDFSKKDRASRKRRKKVTKLPKPKEPVQEDVNTLVKVQREASPPKKEEAEAQVVHLDGPSVHNAGSVQELQEVHIFSLKKYKVMRTEA